MQRRTFLKSAVASSLVTTATGVAAAAETGSTLKHGVHVEAGQDRSKQPLHLGQDRVDAKVTTKDTNGGLYLVEGIKVGKGGPPRHVHHEQDEWFYVIEGEFRFEIGDEKFTAKPGDSVFGPRKVPHVWACVTDTGRMLMAVQPAGAMETIFRRLAAFTKPPTKEELDEAHEGTGVTILGEPLKVD